MAEIVTAAALLAGSGAGGWLAEKLLGPSFSALGDQFRAFAGRRINKIFDRAQQNVSDNEIIALPPGFAWKFLQAASYSADDDTITDMWAGLLNDAAHGANHRHNIFVDVLSQIGPEEAAYLNEMFPKDKKFKFVDVRPRDIRPTLFDTAKRSIDWARPKTENDAKRVVEHLIKYDFEWPAVVRSAEHYWPTDMDNGSTHIFRESRSFPNSFVIDALNRQKLIEYFDIDFHPGWASPRFDGYFMTTLGVDFILSCRGKRT
jgi:Abortive infection alpha